MRLFIVIFPSDVISLLLPNCYRNFFGREDYKRPNSFYKKMLLLFCIAVVVVAAAAAEIVQSTKKV